MLHTDPKYQRQGAASALMKWGLETADKMGLPVYLESSPDAHGFYQKHGFRDIGTFPLDLSQYGGSHLHTTPLMIRRPGGDNE
jgi:GNAT superfamily N-acetyltransferase